MVVLESFSLWPIANSSSVYLDAGIAGIARGERKARSETAGFSRYHHLSRSPCLLHFFINGELKMPRRRRQREHQKSNRLNRQNNNSASRIFCIFLYHHCTTTTLKSLISRFMENLNKSRRNFLFSSERGYGCWEFDSRRVRLHLTK